jgi:hypothetical protein
MSFQYIDNDIPPLFEVLRLVHLLFKMLLLHIYVRSKSCMAATAHVTTSTSIVQ